MIFTWNDYGEGTAIAPSQNQYNHPSLGYYDLTGYYTTWLRKGAPPKSSTTRSSISIAGQTYRLAANSATISA
ncbi:hypothetical protein [Methylocella sp.]|uniref:hypothetical protein n=1 Tax=Methylocella sp. TaxID=1978226 RepID=UPI0037836088